METPPRPSGPLPSATVIVINWNGGVHLRRCLDHLAAQTEPPARVIVVDNGSTDGSLAATAAFPAFAVQRLGRNLGFAAAINRALGQCAGDYVALLNPDAFAAPDWLAKLLQAAREHPGIAAFGCRQLAAGKEGVIDGLGDVYHISGLAWRGGHGRRQRGADLEAGEIFSPCACAGLYRLDALRAVGGFDEDFFCYFEDVDLGFRLRLAGFSSAYVPGAVVHHVGGGCSGGHHSPVAVYYGHRNLVWAFVKNMPGSLLWLLLPFHVGLNLVSIAYFAARGQARVILRAKRDALLGIPRVWRKRRATQASRRVSAAAIWRLLDKRLLPFTR